MSNKRALLIWGGPVFADTPSKVRWPEGWSVDVIPVTGNGSSYFGQLAETYRGSDGRILPNLVASKGKNLKDYEKVMLAGFSAFHGLANEILKADADLVDAMVSLDACFSGITAPRKEGYAKFARKAAANGGLFLLTIGPGGGPGSGATLGPGGVDFSTAYDCVMESVKGAGSLSPFSVPDTLPAPQGAWRSGGLVVLDYRQYRHDQHINQLGVPLMQHFLAPWLAGAGYDGWGMFFMALALGSAAVIAVTLADL